LLHDHEYRVVPLVPKPMLLIEPQQAWLTEFYDRLRG